MLTIKAQIRQDRHVRFAEIRTNSSVKFDVVSFRVISWIAFLTPIGWRKKLQEIGEAQKKQQLLEAATISFIAPGDQEKEKAFNQQGEDTNQDRMTGRTGRRSKKWFSYDVPVDPNTPVALLVTYNTDERGQRSGEIVVDGERVGEQSIDRSPPGSATGRFFDVEYKLPAGLIKDKKKVTVKFQATGGNETATMFGLRTVRAAADK